MKPEAKTRNIDEGIGYAAKKCSNGGFEIIPEHAWRLPNGYQPHTIF
jgi:hypothetical protein